MTLNYVIQTAINIDALFSRRTFVRTFARLLRSDIPALLRFCAPKKNLTIYHEIEHVIKFDDGGDDGDDECVDTATGMGMQSINEADGGGR